VTPGRRRRSPRIAGAAAGREKFSESLYHRGDRPRNEAGSGSGLGPPGSGHPMHRSSRQIAGVLEQGGHDSELAHLFELPLLAEGGDVDADPVDSVVDLHGVFHIHDALLCASRMIHE